MSITILPKFIFLEIKYISLKKYIFSNFWHSPANLWCITWNLLLILNGFYRRGKKLKGPLAENVKLPLKKRISLHESHYFWKPYACAFKRTLNHVIIWIFDDFVIMWIAVLFTSVGQFTIHRFLKIVQFLLVFAWIHWFHKIMWHNFEMQ